MAVFTLVVEGPADAAVLRRITDLTGHGLGPIHITGGKGKLDKKIDAFNNAARFSPWLVLRDLDRDAECAPQLVDVLLPKPAEHMYIRVPVRAIESWLIADRSGISRYLSVRPAAVPLNPEQLDHPKRALVDIARHSARREIRYDLVPRAGTSVEVGPGYTARIMDFAMNHWNPVDAAMAADSLARCLQRLRSVR